MTAAEARALEDLRTDVRQLEQAIDGDQGLRVRTALVEAEVRATREEMRGKLDDISTRIDDLRSRTPRPPPPSIPPTPPSPPSSGQAVDLTSWRVLGALLGGLIASFVAGGVGGAQLHAATEQVQTTQAPAPASTHPETP